MGLETGKECSQSVQSAKMSNNINQEGKVGVGVGGGGAALTVSPPEAKEIDCMG